MQTFNLMENIKVKILTDTTLDKKNKLFLCVTYIEKISEEHKKKFIEEKTFYDLINVINVINSFTSYTEFSDINKKLLEFLEFQINLIEGFMGGNINQNTYFNLIKANGRINQIIKKILLIENEKEKKVPKFYNFVNTKYPI